jgi:hypothetical protein
MSSTTDATQAEIQGRMRMQYQLGYNTAIEDAVSIVGNFAGKQSPIAGAVRERLGQAPAPAPAQDVLGAIAAERARQIAAGYDAAHDDAHLAGDIINSSWGASARIYAAQDRGMSGDIEGYKKYLIQAAAQIVAEVERVQRAALAATSTGGTE